MTGGKGKTIALASAAAGGAVLVTCIVCSWGILCEEWDLRQLGSQDLATRQSAGERLAERGSLRAIPRFLDAGEDRLLVKIIDLRGEPALSYLAASLENSSKGHLRWRARLILHNLPHDPATLEAISREMAEPEPSFREAAIVTSRGSVNDLVHCLGRTLGVRSVEAQIWAAKYLETVGPAAVAAIPALVDSARAEPASLRLAAACALARIGADEDLFREALLEGLRSEEAKESSHSYEVLKEAGKDSLPLLIGAVRSDSWPAQLWAASRLLEIGPPASAALPALEEVIRKEEVNQAAQVMAALALAEMGGPKEVFLPLLTVGLRIYGYEYPIAEWCLEWIRELGREARTILPAIVEDLHRLAASEGESDPREFKTLLPVILALEDEALPQVLDLLRNGNAGEKSLALKLLQEMKSRARPAIPAMREALAAGGGMALEAALALSRFREEAQSVLPIASSGIATEKDPARQASWALVLGRLGPPAGAAAGALERLLDGEAIARAAAAEALGRLGPAAKEAIPRLVRALGDRSLTVRLAAVRSLASFGPEAATATPILDQGLYQGMGDRSVFSIWAAYALISIEPGREAELLDRLRAALSSPSSEFRMQAAKALGLLGPRARPALTDLTDLAISEGEPERAVYVSGVLGQIGIGDLSPFLSMLRSGDPALRAKSARCLAEIGRLPVDLLPALREATGDPILSVRRAARAALRHLSRPPRE
jgi:HEAT repeat protein